MGPQLKVQSSRTLYGTPCSIVWEQGRSRRPKWCGYTDINCLGKDQSDKQSQKSTQYLPRKGQKQGFPVKGTGKYGVEGMFSDFVVWFHDSVSSCINKKKNECLQYVPKQGY